MSEKNILAAVWEMDQWMLEGFRNQGSYFSFIPFLPSPPSLPSPHPLPPSFSLSFFLLEIAQWKHICLEMSRELRAADTQHGQQTPSEGSVCRRHARAEGHRYQEVEVRCLQCTEGVGHVGTGADSAAVVTLDLPGFHIPWGALECSLPAGSSAVGTTS